MLLESICIPDETLPRRRLRIASAVKSVVLVIKVKRVSMIVLYVPCSVVLLASSNAIFLIWMRRPCDKAFEGLKIA